MAAFIKSLFGAFAQSITSFLFILLIMMVYAHIKKKAQLEESWLGLHRESQVNELLNVILYGMIVGLIASFLIFIIGITIDFTAILFIWPLALFLMLFNQRYLCFSYAGGIISIISLLFGWPSIDVSAVIALIGILHLIESLLIIMDGHRGSLPVFMEHKRFKPIGAFIMNKLWPIPLLILVVPSGLMKAAPIVSGLPDWWPLFQSSSGMEGLILLPLAAVLGYGDLAVTQSPRKRTRETGFWLAVYSIIILIIAIYSSWVYWMKFAAAILTPLLHEILIYFSKRGQMEGKPIYGAPWRGLRVLEVFPEAIGSKMGFMQGDVLMNINGKAINSEEMLYEFLSTMPSFVWVDVTRGKETVTLEHQDYQNGIKELGIMIVPRQTSKVYRVDQQRGMAFRLWRKFFSKTDISV